MSLEVLLIAAAQAVAAALLGGAAWSLVASRTGLRGDGFGWPEQALFSLVSLVGVSCLFMLAHLVTGGAFFGSAFVAPAAAAAMVVAAGRRRSSWVGTVPWRAVAAAALVLGVLYLTPAVVGGSGVRTGDPPWHLGWTQQLLHGEPVPTGPAPEFGRNAYPWGFHSLLATLTRLVPGSDPVTAHDAVHVLLIAAIPLGAACLARRLEPRAGWAAAGAATLIGGFGWLAAGTPAFFTSPSEARFGADLVVASPNSAYEMLPPAFPREVGLIVAGAVAVALAVAARRGGRRARISAGVAAGVVGLVSLPMFVTALVWVVAASLVAPRGERVAAIGDTLIPALAVFALWAGPVAADYLRHGGFVDVTPQLGVEWPLPTALWSWGMLLPAALAGLVVAVRARREPAARVLLACTAATGAVLVSALLRGRFGWDLAGHATLLHQGRVWPPAHLLGAAFAGPVIVRAFLWATAPRRRTAALGGVIVLALGAASPLYASIGLTRIVAAHRGGFGFGLPDVARGSFVRRAASHLGPDDVLLVEGSPLLAFLSFSFSGARLAAYQDPRLAGNDLRIRYADLAARWDVRVAGEGFTATWAIVPFEEVPPGTRPVESGDFDGARWALLRAGP